MANRPEKTKLQALWSELSTPVLIVAAFLLGAGGMWAIMRASSSGAPEKPVFKRFVPPSNAESPGLSQLAPDNTAGPPDVSQLTPADAARTLANWNYDRKNWPHAIEHYQEAIARGADNPDVRTDLGNCFRFVGQPQKALEQVPRSPKEKTRSTRTASSIRPASSPKCCTIRRGPYRSLANSLRDFPKVRGRSQRRKLILELQEESKSSTP